MENINPCNIQRSLGEIRCLFCFVYLTLIVLLFLYMVFLRNKNGLWLLKQTPTCQGGKEAFGLIERSSSFFYSKSNKSAILMVMMRRRVPPACRLKPSLSCLCAEVWGFIRKFSSSVLVKNVVQKSLPAQLCWVMSILTEVYMNVWRSPCLHLCT